VTTSRCVSCGEAHDLSSLSFGASSPDQWERLTAEERAASILTPDQCVLRADGAEHFFLRACLEVPVHGWERPFSWGVWVSLSERSFEEVCDRWDDHDRTALGPHFGWLCTPIPGYPDTMFLKSRVHQRAPGLRPLVELEPTDHPLAVHQREGISEQALRALVLPLLHEA
jgi:hypothetical protein